jgi:de-etiolated-1
MFNNILDGIGVYKEFNIRKSRPINIVATLKKRELGANNFNTTRESNFQLIKRIYLSIYPSLTIINVKIPNCYLKKFTPDGQHLVAYNQTLTGIHVYKYEGCAKIFDFIDRHYGTSHWFEQDKCDLNARQYDRLREGLFDLLFREIRHLKLITHDTYSPMVDNNNELINREFTLFYENYMILASSEYVNDDQLPSYDELTTNNECVHVNPIENYTFYLIRIGSDSDVSIADKIQFKCDKILLTHNNGVHLYKNQLTILSQQNQTIHIYLIIDRPTSVDGAKVGKYFQLVQRVGRFCYRDDEDYLRSSMTMDGAQLITLDKPFTEVFFTGLKHKILSYFFKSASECNRLSNFYMLYNTIMALKMQKHQMLDDTHVFIKYVHTEYLLNQQKPQTSSSSATNDLLTSQFYFVLYDLVNGSVVNIFPSNSSELFHAYEHFNDFFTLCTVNFQYNYHTLASNNDFAKQTLQRYIRNVSKLNTRNEMIKCLLSQIPISAQSYTLTPYLDHMLFSYDEKIISNFDRPKAIGDQIVR